MLAGYESGLEIQRGVRQVNTALENVIGFYQENKQSCDMAYSYYQEYSSNKKKYVNTPYKVQKEEFIKMIGENTIFILTANEIEEAVLLYTLSNIYKKQLGSYIIDGNVYQVIVTEKYTLIHNHTSKTGDEYTRRAINAVTKIFFPSYIFLLGVCYGIDFRKYDLGTVFISNFVQGFRVNFRDQEDSAETLYEAEVEFSQEPNRELVKIISNFFNYYQPENEFFSSNIDKVLVKIAPGKLLSSNSLVSSKKVKDAVMFYLGGTKPKPLGGEMEACGIFKSNYFEETDFDGWLIIKSICDWGEKKNALSKDEAENDKIKNSIQAYAMMNTCVVFHEILEKKLLNYSRKEIK